MRPADPDCPWCEGEGMVEDQEGDLVECECTEDEALAA
jgi:hypothetical protein